MPADGGTCGHPLEGLGLRAPLGDEEQDGADGLGPGADDARELVRDGEDRVARLVLRLAPDETGEHVVHLPGGVGLNTLGEGVPLGEVEVLRLGGTCYAQPKGENGKKNALHLLFIFMCWNVYVYVINELNQVFFIIFFLYK